MSTTATAMNHVRREESAAEIVERRRLQNRLSQQRYREKMRKNRQTAKDKAGTMTVAAATAAAVSTNQAGRPIVAMNTATSESPESSSSSFVDSSSSYNAASASSASTSPSTHRCSPTVQASDSALQSILDTDNINLCNANGGHASYPHQISHSGSFYTQLSTMLEDPVDLINSMSIIPTLYPEMQRASFNISLQARSFFEVVPEMTKAFGVPLYVVQDKKAQITFSPTFFDYDSSTEAFYTSEISNGIIKSSFADKPRTMLPTALQLRGPHQLGLALTFPWPSVRDQFILRRERYMIPSQELCNDLVNGVQIKGEPWQPAMMIWGDDAFDPDNWEIGHGFLVKYAEVFENKIVQRTNWWRKKRNLPPIILTANRTITYR